MPYRFQSPTQQEHRLHSTFHCPARYAILLSLTALALSLSLSAQETAGNPPPQTTTIKVTARLVVLDIVVTDKSGKTVNDLTAKDFRVLEDGAQQTIRNFEAPSAHVLPAPAAASPATTVFDPAHPASFAQSPVTVLVLDQLNTHFADSSFARRSLRDYLTKQPPLLTQPTTLLSVSDNSFKTLQGYTRDRAALLKALEAAPVKYAWTLEVDGKAAHGPLERLEQSLHALESIAENAARVPGRKNLVWVGGGFPGVDPNILDHEDNAIVKDTLQHVTDVLLATRVTLYAVDPTTSAAGVTEITDASQMAFMSAVGESAGTNSDPFDSQEDFNRLGPVTGGRVLRGMNDIAQQIAISVDQGSNFYTIGYSPTSTSAAAAKYRKIQIICLRPGLTATTRSGYYSNPPQPRSALATAAYDLSAAAESSMPLNGLRVTVEPDNSVSAPPHTYILHVGADTLSWAPKDDGTSTASVYVMAVWLNAKKVMVNHQLHGMIATAKSGTNLTDPTRLANFSFTTTLTPKATWLRFVVRDSTTGRIGSVDTQIGK